MRSLYIVSTVTLALVLAACGGNTAREVGEEGKDFMDKVGPSSEVAPTPAPPPAQIDVAETLGAVEQAGALTKLPPSVAADLVDRWIGTLDGNLVVDDTDLLVENLTTLRTQIAQPKIDGEAVAVTLRALARETEQAAEDADDALVDQLAELLEDTADALD